jgi:hypothetical protein|tara:strand:- start:2829 stop:3098 length:270 start_codon:yes stop_codon:yes gene_type:complete
VPKGKKWRTGAHYSLWSRPIYKDEIPKLVQAMEDDGLICVLVENSKGHQWYMHEYPIQAKAIREVWGISLHQWPRIMDWILINDPFGCE